MKSNNKLNNITTKIITTGTDINCLYFFFQVVDQNLLISSKEEQDRAFLQSRVRFLMGPKPALGVNGLV